MIHSRMYAGQFLRVMLSVSQRSRKLIASRADPTVDTCNAYLSSEVLSGLPTCRVIHRPFVERILLDVFYFVDHATDSRTQSGKMINEILGSCLSFG
ncbi:MAG: hypothetical protein JWQ49_2182 [Edaphobacter sp.]|nr:hypothetical protein [Edaphobacter sp.]